MSGGGEDTLLAPILAHVTAGRYAMAVKLTKGLLASGLLPVAALGQVTRPLARHGRFDDIRQIVDSAPCETWKDVMATLKAYRDCGMATDGLRHFTHYSEPAMSVPAIRIGYAMQAVAWLDEVDLDAMLTPVIDHAAANGWAANTVHHLVRLSLRRGNRRALARLRAGAGAGANPGYPWVFQTFDYGLAQIDAIRPTAAPAESPDVYLHAAMWGADYIETFRAYVLPALLAPGNLPAFAAGRRVTLRVDTRAGADALTLRETLAELPLDRHVAVEVHEHDPALFTLGDREPGQAALELWSMLVHIGCHQARADGADIVFLFPDVMMADGSLAYLRTLMGGGDWDVFALQNCGGSLEKAAPLLSPYRRPDGSLVINAADLVDITLASLGERHHTCIIGDDTVRVPGDVGFLIEPLEDGLRITYSPQMPVYMTRAALEAMSGFDMIPMDDGVLENLCRRGLDYNRVHFPRQFGPYGALALERRSRNWGFLAGPPPEDWAGAVIQQYIEHEIIGPLRLRAMTEPLECRGTGKVAPPVAPSLRGQQLMADLRQRAAWLLDDQFIRPGLIPAHAPRPSAVPKTISEEKHPA